MSVFADYSPEEQQLLLRSLDAAGIAVSAASLGRKVETASEGFAAASYIMESHRDYLGNTLITSIQFELDQRVKAEKPFPNFEKLASAPGAKEAAMETLRQVSALLTTKTTPEEAAGYAEWLMNIAVATSKAGKEGGNFMGWGAVMVNEAEEAALKEIAQVLGVQS